MKCPLCLEQEVTSSLREHGVTQTMLGGDFTTYDEAGKKHHHDPNKSTTNYTCSRGHGFVVKRRAACWCGWGQSDIEVRAYLPEGSWASIRSGTERKINDPAILKAMVA